MSTVDELQNGLGYGASRHRLAIEILSLRLQQSWVELVRFFLRHTYRRAPQEYVTESTSRKKGVARPEHDIRYEQDVWDSGQGAHCTGG